jgi:hypothetical protein
VWSPSIYSISPVTCNRRRPFPICVSGGGQLLSAAAEI